MIVLVRHGETDWNRDNRFQGHADPPLNESGRAQALTLARSLAVRPDALYSSPLARARETAEIVGLELGLEVQLDDDLREVDVGSWSGLTRTEVEERFPAGYRRWLEYGHGWEDGETYEALGERVLASVHRIAEMHSGERVLAVTHGGPIRSVLAAAAGVPFGEARRSIHVLGNCAAVVFAAGNGIIQRVD
jgi:probable phosphoglycerate mutase